MLLYSIVHSLSVIITPQHLDLDWPLETLIYMGL
jgi:hypothetical protein